MIRILSTFCIGLMGFCCLANYHVSEQTRIARQELARTEKQIKTETQNINALELQWQKVANPAEVQKLAEAQLGMQNGPSVQMASVQMLPHRGDGVASEDVHPVAAEAAVQAPRVVKISLRSGM